MRLGTGLHFHIICITNPWANFYARKIFAMSGRKSCISTKLRLGTSVAVYNHKSQWALVVIVFNRRFRLTRAYRDRIYYYERVPERRRNIVIIYLDYKYLLTMHLL